MTDYFTLNPKYERYELGIAELQRETFFPPPVPKDIDIDPSKIIPVPIGIGIAVLLALSYFLLGQPSKPTMLQGSILVMGLLAVGSFFFYIVRHTEQTPRRFGFERLKKYGILIDGVVERSWYDLGQVTNRNQFGTIKSVEWKRTLTVSYTFVSPTGQTLTGEQRRLVDTGFNKPLDRAALLNDPVPAKDMLIRVLYLDDMTYVML